MESLCKFFCPNFCLEKFVLYQGDKSSIFFEVSTIKIILIVSYYTTSA